MSDSSKSQGLTISTCIMIAIGGMMGSSIFTLSGVTYAMAGPGALLTWALAGLVLFLYSLNISELATTFPRSGGIFVYPHEVLGKTKEQKDFAGWMAAWSWLNVSVLGISFSAICITTYLQEFLPAVKNSGFLQLLIPVAWIGVCWMVNRSGSGLAGKVNNLLTITLIFVCGVYIFAGLPQVNVENLTPFAGGSMGAKGILAGIPIAMLAYGSIIAIASIAGEIRNPQRSIPKIMGISVIITVAVYLLILLATFGMAPVEDFLTDPGRQYYPLAYALQKGLAGKATWLVGLIPLGALLAISTTMLVLTMDSSRTVSAVAEAGFLPDYFARLDPKTGTPVRSLTLVGLVSALITLKPDWIWAIINTGSICCAVTVGIIAVTLIALRRHPERFPQKGVFRVPGGILFPVLTLLVIVVTLILLYFGDGGPQSYLMALGWYGAGLLIYAVSNWKRHKSHKP